MSEEIWKETWQTRLNDWLEEEKLGSPMMVEKSWDVEITDEGAITADSWCTPFTLEIKPTKKDEKNFIDLTVRTPVGTAMLHTDEKVNLYRTMLKLNQRSELVKFGLEDIDDDIVIKADFDLTNLSKKEFDHGLRHQLEIGSFLLTSVIAPDTLQEFIDEEDWEEYEFYNTMEKFAVAMKEGEITKDIAVNRLVDIGYEEETAERLIEDLNNYIDKSEEQTSDGLDYRR